MVKKVLCWLIGHKESIREVSYNYCTRGVSFHCARCQTVTREVGNEALLTDREWVWFKEIFTSVAE